MPETKGAREEILAKLRASIVPAKTDADRKLELASIPRTFRTKGALSSEHRIDLFEERLRDYGAGVYHTSKAELPLTLATVLGKRSKRTILASQGVPESWLWSQAQSEIRIIRDDNLSFDQLDKSEGVITGCTVGIAFTGTLVLQGGPSEGRRALTLVPDYYLCVVASDQVVELVPEALARLRLAGQQPTTFISGPSATADIEMIRVQGVHGPRVLDVVIVS